MFGFLDEFILPGTSPWLFWSFVLTGVIIQGISKSGFAGGAGRRFRSCGEAFGLLHGGARLLKGQAAAN